jgi:hypothetical protein
MQAAALCKPCTTQHCKFLDVGCRRVQAKSAVECSGSNSASAPSPQPAVADHPGPPAKQEPPQKPPAGVTVDTYRYRHCVLLSVGLVNDDIHIGWRLLVGLRWVSLMRLSGVLLVWLRGIPLLWLRWILL